MKIVFGKDVFYPLFKGGGEVHTFKVAQKLVEFGHEVTVLCGKTSQFPSDSMSMLKSLPDEEVIDGIRIIRSKKQYRYGSSIASLPALYEMYKTLKGMIKDNEVDVVNFDLYRPCLPFLMAARNKVPCVLSARVLVKGYKSWRGWEDYDAPLLGKLSQFIAEETLLRVSYDKIFADSSDVYHELINHYPPEKLGIVYNGVDLEQYDTVKANEKKPYQLVFIGALKKRKNVMDAVNAVKLAKKEIEDLRFIVISAGGDLENELKKESKDSDYIAYYKDPEIDVKIRFLKESSLLIFPSLKEGFPLVPLEGLACRTPFVAYDIPSMIEEKKLTSGGVLVPFQNSYVLSQKIVELLKDQKTLRELGKVGRESVESRFSWEKIARREERLFMNCIENFNRKK